MHTTTYATVSGFVQFDPDVRDVNGQTVRDIKVRDVGTQKRIRITIWPEFAQVSVVKGDFVAAEGKLRITTAVADDGSQREYLDLDARSLARLPHLEEVVPDLDDLPF